MQISSAKCGAWMRLILECELSIYDLLCNATVQGQLRAAHNRVSNQERYSFTPGCDAYFCVVDSASVCSNHRISRRITPSVRRFLRHCSALFVHDILVCAVLTPRGLPVIHCGILFSITVFGYAIWGHN